MFSGVSQPGNGEQASLGSQGAAGFGWARTGRTNCVGLCLVPKKITPKSLN